MAVSTPFPTIIPNYITGLVPGDYGVQIFRFDDNSESRRPSTETALGTKITLKYEGRTDSETAAVLDFYSLTQGMKESFVLPESINNHPTQFKTALSILNPINLWRFARPLKITTVYKGIYTFDVELKSVAI